MALCDPSPRTRARRLRRLASATLRDRFPGFFINDPVRFPPWSPRNAMASVSPSRCGRLARQPAQSCWLSYVILFSQNDTSPGSWLHNIVFQEKESWCLKHVSSSVGQIQSWIAAEGSDRSFCPFGSYALDVTLNKHCARKGTQNPSTLCVQAGLDHSEAL